MINTELNEKGIYKITCKLNGKKYIGSTKTSFKSRFKKHKQRLRHNYHENSYLQNSWNKYGEENFIFSIIEKIKDINKIKEREEYWINTIFNNGKNRDICFNLTNNCGGGNTLQDEKIKKIHSENIKKSYTEELKNIRRIHIKKRIPLLKKILAKIIKSKKWKKNHLIGVREMCKTEEWNLKNKENHKNKMKAVKNDLGEVFESVLEASKAINRSGANIRACINGKTSHCAGRLWFYV